MSGARVKRYSLNNIIQKILCFLGEKTEVYILLGRLSPTTHPAHCLRKQRPSTEQPSSAVPRTPLSPRLIPRPLQAPLHWAAEQSLQAVSCTVTSPVGESRSQRNSISRHKEATRPLSRASSWSSGRKLTQKLQQYFEWRFLVNHYYILRPLSVPQLRTEQLTWQDSDVSKDISIFSSGGLKQFEDKHHQLRHVLAQIIIAGFSPTSCTGTQQWHRAEPYYNPLLKSLTGLCVTQSQAEDFDEHCRCSTRMRFDHTTQAIRFTG